jgi:hypothetical protein
MEPSDVPIACALCGVRCACDMPCGLLRRSLCGLMASTLSTPLRKSLMFSYLIPAITHLTTNSIDPPQQRRIRRAPAAAASAFASTSGDAKSAAPAAASGAAGDMKSVAPPTESNATGKPPLGLAPIELGPSRGVSGVSGGPVPSPNTPATPATPATPVGGSTGQGIDIKAAMALRENKLAVSTAANAVLATVHVWTNRRSEFVAERAVALCTAHNPLFVKEFANAFAVYLSKHILKTPDQFNYAPVILKLFRSGGQSAQRTAHSSVVGID